jgi:hypothetical protein
MKWSRPCYLSRFIADSWGNFTIFGDGGALRSDRANSADQNRDAEQHDGNDSRHIGSTHIGQFPGFPYCWHFLFLRMIVSLAGSKSILQEACQFFKLLNNKDIFKNRFSGLW